MTSRNLTPLMTLDSDEGTARDASRSSLAALAWRIGFGAISWPWLAVSLWGGRQASKRALLKRVGLRDDALPHLGSWKADTGFLHRIVDAVKELQPQTVVELGAGATTLVCAKALALHGGGRLYSFDQHSGFVDATRQWLRDESVGSVTLEHAPLRIEIPEWGGSWYDLSDLPERIDLLIIDGPPWTVHPFIRGAAEALFDRLSPGARVLLDDAARPGERIVARRWQKRWPQIRFERVAGSTKGTLVGNKLRTGEIMPFRPRAQHKAASSWSRAAMVVAAFGAGWLANDFTGRTDSAKAKAFIEEADASYAATQARHRMFSQIETPRLDREEIARTTGISLPKLPAGWTVQDVQVYPSNIGVAVALALRTDAGQAVSLFATRAETPAEKLPLLERREDRSLAYWEEGPVAYALSGKLPAEQVLSLAALLSQS